MVSVTIRLSITENNLTENNKNNMEGYITKDYGQPVKRYVQTMELKDNPELIKKYKEAHSEE